MTGKPKPRSALKSPVIVYLPADCIRELRLMAGEDYMSLSAEVRKIVIQAVRARKKV